MGFFVPREMQEKSKKQSDPASDRLDLIFLVNAKKMGFSFQELNVLRVIDFVEVVNIYTGKSTRKASQEDIDKLLA